MTNVKISRSDLVPDLATSEARITKAKHLASYNWLDISTPTIVVPGHPPEWSNVKHAKQVKQDAGLIYIAQNAARHPDSPLEPLLRALYVAQPDFDATHIDVVTDRNNIRKLLSFVNPEMAKHGLEEFEIKAQIIGNTVWLQREEAKVQEIIPPHEFRGYGHEFEKAYTTNVIAGTTGHHRIISYRFGRFDMLVRHETDGYVKEGDCLMTSSQTDDISSMLSGLSLKANPVASDRLTFDTKLSVIKKGQVVPLSLTLEMKTRAYSKPIPLGEVIPQLWVSQTPKLVRAYHRKGIFQVPRVEDVASELSEWEEEHQQSLKRLEVLIQMIVNQTKEYRYAIITYSPVDDKLSIAKTESFSSLPRDLYQKWAKPSVAYAEEHDSFNDQKNLSAISTVRGADKQTMRIGNQTYDIPLDKFPCLEKFVRDEVEHGETELKHPPIPYFDVMFKGVTRGYRHSIRLLQEDIADYESVFATCDDQRIDITGGQTLDQTLTSLKATVDGCSDDRSEFKKNRAIAQDAAFQLIYHVLRARVSELADPTKNKLYNAVSFIASHPKTFNKKTRSAVRTAYIHNFQISTKQLANLDLWTKKYDRDDDASTSASESSVYWNSSDDGGLYSD
nr:hypothetical protein CFP56_33605 [Quercus suber]